jgi:tripartite-type tricarboxylate transporter receptor subunit TctC
MGDLVGEGRAVETHDERLRGTGSVNERLMNTLPTGRIPRRTFLRQALALALLAPAAAAFLASFEEAAEARAFQATPEATPIAPPPRPADFPSGPIQFWIGYPEGGSSDVGGRILAAAMEKMLGQPVPVVNKPGGSGQVAWTEMARQKPDASVVALVSVPQLQTIILDPERQAAFTLEDFTPIANQVLDPGAVFVTTNSPFQTMNDFLNGAKERPGQITVGDTGIASDDHLAILDTERAAGVDVSIVHFDGGPAAAEAVLGGQVDAVYDNVGQWVTKVKAGEGRVLAVMGQTRSEFLPDVPTMDELGYPVFDYSARGIVGPKRMNPEHARYLSGVIEAAMSSAEVQTAMNEVGIAQKYMGPEEYAQFLQEQMDYAADLFHLVEEERKAQ